MSSEIAWRAASLISAGAAKSGNPCERFTALCFIASRVISRMTDSVNCSALAEIMRREIPAIFDSGVLISLRDCSALLQRTSVFPAVVALTALRRLGAAGGGRLRARSINHPVERGIAQHDLDIVACFRERDRLDKFGNLVIIAFGLPQRDAVLAGVVRSQCELRRSSQIHETFEIIGAEFDVVFGIE